MATFAIPGMTADSIAQTDTKPSVAYLKPYPVSFDRYEQATGKVISVEVKQIGDTEYFSVKVENNGHGAEILVATDPSRTNPKSTMDEATQLQKNLARLTKFVKTLGIFNAKGQVDEALFPKAVGKLIVFAAKNKHSKDGKYTNTSGLFEGAADQLVIVHSVDAPAAVADTEDIPF